MQGLSRVSRQVVAVAVAAVHVIAIAAATPAVTGCGGKDRDSGSGKAALDPGAGSGAGSAAGSAGDEAPAGDDEAPANAAYIVLRDKGLVAIEHGMFRTIAPLPDAPAKLGAVAVGPDGTLWASGEGLASYDGKTWKQHALPSTLRDSFVHSLVFAADGARYGVAGGVLVAGRGDTWTALTAGGPSIRDVALAGDGTIYVSLRDQVARLAADKLVPIVTVKGDSPSLVTAPDGTVHVFHRKGAYRIAAGKLEPLAKLPSTVGQVFGVDGALYGISADGKRIVRRRADGAVDKFPADKDLPFKAKSITVDTSNRLWLVLEHGMAILATTPCPSAPRSSVKRAFHARAKECARVAFTLLMPGEVPELSRDIEAIIVTGDGPDLRDVEALKLITKFTSAIISAERLTLHEGLPHPREEPALMAIERRSKPVQELHRDWFYKEPLAPSAEDVKRLTQVLSDPATFTPYMGAGCGCSGFHADYAVEWQQGSSVYRALICFGCGGAVLLGPELDVRCDLDLRVSGELKALLTKYRKNRPPPSPLCEGLDAYGFAGTLPPWIEGPGTRGTWERFLSALACAQRGYFR